MHTNMCGDAALSSQPRSKTESAGYSPSDRLAKPWWQAHQRLKMGSEI